MHLYSISQKHRIRLKARVGDEDMDGAEIDSVTSIWPGMNWLEREVWDMSGVRFRGHPDLRRILMYPEFEGHPLQRIVSGRPARSRSSNTAPKKRRGCLSTRSSRSVPTRACPSAGSGRRREPTPTRAIMEPLDIDLDEGELELPAEPMHLNMGPSHPAMHGTVRIVLELSGETIVKADVQIGYLHRGFEKMCERGTWAQVFPYVDRLNYVSPMLNNVGYALAVEKLCGLSVPERCQWYRMALGELARISDHLTCTGAMAMELGAFTPFLWFVKAREMVWDILEEETGARLTHSFGRIGGMAKPPSPDFKGMCARGPRAHPAARRGGRADAAQEPHLHRPPPERRSDQRRRRPWGSDGRARACARPGVAYDIRKAHPYLKYDEVDFDVPVGTRGDTLDRFLVRLGEIRQSKRIIEQSLERMADDGPINCDDPRVMLPEKMDVYTTIEATIQHFKLVMEGAKVPAGEVYSYTEGGNGELGYYLVSDGSGTPYRVRIRPPCFQITGGLHRLIEGRMLSDIVPTFGALNMIGGECDH